MLFWREYTVSFWMNCAVWAPLLPNVFACAPVTSSSVPAQTRKSVLSAEPSISLPDVRETIEPGAQRCLQCIGHWPLPFRQQGSRSSAEEICSWKYSAIYTMGHEKFLWLEKAREVAIMPKELDQILEGFPGLWLLPVSACCCARLIAFFHLWYHWWCLHKLWPGWYCQYHPGKRSYQL